MNTPPDPDDLIAHLRTVLSQPSHWLLTSDAPEATRLISGFAILLAIGGTTDVWFEQFNFLVLSTRETSSIGIMTVPKSGVDRGIIAEFLREGFGRELVGDQDLAVISEDATQLAAVLSGIQTGKVFMAPDPISN